MTSWHIENPDKRRFALIWTEGYEYQFAQFDHVLKEWAFYYMNGLRTIDPQRVPVWWHKLPRPPKGYETPRDEHVFELESKS